MQFNEENKTITGGLIFDYYIEPGKDRRPVLNYKFTSSFYSIWNSYPGNTSVSSINYWRADRLHKLSINLDENSMFRLITANSVAKFGDNEIQSNMANARDGFYSQYYNPNEQVEITPGRFLNGESTYWIDRLPKLQSAAYSGEGRTRFFPLADVSETTKLSWKIASVDLNGVIRRGEDAYKITKGDFFFQPPKLEDLSDFLSNKSFYLAHVLKGTDGLLRVDPYATHRINLKPKWPSMDSG